MDQFKDAHYFHIPSQGNIYTMTKLKLANGKILILAASLKRDIFYFEYLEASQGLEPTTKEISFTYIPSKYYQTILCNIMEVFNTAFT